MDTAAGGCATHIYHTTTSQKITRYNYLQHYNNGWCTHITQAGRHRQLRPRARGYNTHPQKERGRLPLQLTGGGVHLNSGYATTRRGALCYTQGQAGTVSVVHIYQPTCTENWCTVYLYITAGFIPYRRPNSWRLLQQAAGLELAGRLLLVVGCVLSSIDVEVAFKVINVAGGVGNSPFQHGGPPQCGEHWVGSCWSLPLGVHIGSHPHTLPVVC